MRSVMEHKVSTIEKVGETLILPFFEGINKPPNRSLVGLSRGAQNQVKGAISSNDFEQRARTTVLSTQAIQLCLIQIRIRRRQFFSKE